MTTVSNHALDWSSADERAVDLVRVLAMDAVQEAGNGHPGTAMSLAPAAYLLYHRILRHDPADLERTEPGHGVRGPHQAEQSTVKVKKAEEISGGASRKGFGAATVGAGLPANASAEAPSASESQPAVPARRGFGFGGLSTGGDN